MQAKLPALVAAIVFAGVVGTYLALALYDPPAYVFATYEDLIGEWLQTFGFVAALVFSLLIAAARGPFRWFFGLLALALFYTVMEEISWGQRIFGFETPQFLKEGNIQGEANIHNLFTGPVGTDTKVLIEYLMAGAFVAYGAIYPLLLRWNWKPALWIERLGIPAPPLYLWPFFVTAAWLELGPLNFNEAEVAELLVAFALAIFALHYWFARRCAPNQSPHTVPAAEAGGRLATAMVLSVAGITLLASVTTWAVYNSPDIRANIDTRLLNGYEKFASRYGEKGRWDVAVQLYTLAQEKNPESAYYMRRLADAFRNMGDEALFKIHNEKALELAARDLATKPESISANLSVARSYRQAGDAAKAGYYVQQAHAIALKRVEAEPDDAHDHYWLAKTYRELGDYRSAREHFRRAAELRPTSTKYRRAWLEMQPENDGE